MSNVKWFYDPFNGNCFQINSNLSNIFKVDHPKSGLKLEIFTGLPTLPNLFPEAKKGIRLEIKYPDGYPFMFNSIPIDIGVSTSINLSPTSNEILPRPFSDCVDSKDLKGIIYSEMQRLGIDYNREQCLDIFSQFTYIQKFGCYDVRCD